MNEQIKLILRLMLRGELARNTTPERNREIALQLINEQPNIAQADALDWVNRAPEIIGTNLDPTDMIISGPGANMSVADADAMGVFDPATSITEPIVGTGPVLTDDGITRIHDIVSDDPVQSAREKFEEQQRNRQASFRDFIGEKFRPGAGGFLRRGLEERFEPLDLLFRTRGALGQNPFDAGGRAQTFQDFMGVHEGGRPTMGTLQQLARDADLRIQQGMGAGPLSFEAKGTGEAAEFFTGEGGPANQFQLALQSRLGEVPSWARAGFANQATQRFNRYLARNPENANMFLRSFMSGGGF
jgi:hypothetical protein